MPGSFSKTRSLVALLAALASLAPVCVGSGGALATLTGTTPVTEGARLEIDARNVSVRVLRGKPGVITSRADLRNRSRVIFRSRRSSVSPSEFLQLDAIIEDRYVARAWGRLTVEVPDGTELAVSGENVTVEVEGARESKGTITLVNGPVSVENVTGALEITTGRGGVWLRGVAGRFDARTERGSIYLRGTIGGDEPSRLETGAGSIFADISDTPDLPVAAIAERGAVLTHDGSSPAAGVDVRVTPAEGPAALELVTANGMIDIRRKADARPQWPPSP